jgi:hypothetical protein
MMRNVMGQEEGYLKSMQSAEMRYAMEWLLKR